MGFRVFVWAYLVLIFYAIASTYYAYSKLSKPGISGEIRALVLKRHIIAVTAYIICNSYIFVTAIYLSNKKERLNFEQ